MRKIPFAGIELKSQRVRGLRGTSELPGRPVAVECVFSSHLFWTSNSLDVPARVTQEEGYKGFLIHLPSAVLVCIAVLLAVQSVQVMAARDLWV